MYSLQDIAGVYPKLETVSDEGELDEDDTVSNHSDGQMDRMSEEFPLNNNTESNTTANEVYSFREENSTNDRHMGPHGQANETPPGLAAGTNTQSAGHTTVSGGMTERQTMNEYTTDLAYRNGGQEALYYSVSAAGRVLDTGTISKGIDANGVESSKVPYYYGAPEGLPAYQSSIYRTIPFVSMASTEREEFSPYQGLSVYGGTHRSLTLYEMGLQRKPCCNCPCHLPASSPLPVPELKSQRPSVIMVPAKNNPSWEASVKVDTTPRRLGSVHINLRQNLPHVGYNEMADLDSSDDDGNETHEKYFRMNIDGNTARFKLTKEDWERIPINTFPSGGRLLSGDWTRIFINKVKESNPWCSLRFKNNHVRSENSRKIHSAVFFRGGAECKRPECNVKVRFVIRKERGKHVDVTYVGNVCHSRQPGVSDAIDDKKRKCAQVRRARISPSSVSK